MGKLEVVDAFAYIFQYLQEKFHHSSTTAKGSIWTEPVLHTFTLPSCLPQLFFLLPFSSLYCIGNARTVLRASTDCFLVEWYSHVGTIIYMPCSHYSCELVLEAQADFCSLHIWWASLLVWHFLALEHSQVSAFILCSISSASWVFPHSPCLLLDVWWLTVVNNVNSSGMEWHTKSQVRVRNECKKKTYWSQGSISWNVCFLTQSTLKRDLFSQTWCNFLVSREMIDHKWRGMEERSLYVWLRWKFLRRMLEELILKKSNRFGFHNCRL